MRNFSHTSHVAVGYLMCMGYTEALKAAGAKVLSFESFGSYQGDWYAKVVYQGEVLLVAGAFGSCSHCDAFEAEFGYDYEESENYQSRLARFGEGYLDDPRDPEKELSRAKENSSWDMESREMAEWLAKNF